MIIRHIVKLSSVRVYLPKDIRSLESRNAVRRSLQGVLKKFPDGPPLLDPVKDMRIQEEDFKTVVKVCVSFMGRMFFCRETVDNFKIGVVGREHYDSSYPTTTDPRIKGTVKEVDAVN